MVALVVTLACLPLLVIDAVGASSSSRPTQAASSPEPSLVVANSPSTESTSTTLPASTTTSAPPAAAPVTTTTTRVAPVWAPPVTAPPVTVRSQSDAEFLACVRQRESHGDYTAVDSSGRFMGAYQIYQGGWDDIAAQLGRTDLIGVPPHHASPADQDQIALRMLVVHGRSPWGGSCG